MRQRVTSLAFLALLPGCARTPPVTVTYFLPRTELTVEVLRSLACTDQKLLTVADTLVDPAPRTVADRSRFFPLDLASLDSRLSNSDIALNLQPDGRLAGVNASSTGQAGDIIKAALSVVTAAATIVPFAAEDKRPDGACAVLGANPKEPATITYAARLDFPQRGEAVRASAIGGGDLLDADLRAKATPEQRDRLRDICVTTASEISPAPAGIVWRESSGPRVTVGVPAPVTIRVALLRRDAACTQGAGAEFWSGTILVHQRGHTAEIPVPPPVAFSSSTFKLAIAADSTIQTLGYTSNSGLTSALNAGAAMANLPADTATARANAAKARADQIAANERLVRCRTDPSNCK